MNDESSKKKKYSSRWWLDQIKQARKDREQWLADADKYEREWNDPGIDSSNLFFSNTKLESPAIYSRIPSIVSKVRYGSKDDIARVGAKIVEKPTAYQAEEKPDFDEAMKAVLHESHMCGRGVARIRYEKEEGPVQVRVDLFPQEIPGTQAIDPMTGQPIPGTGQFMLVDVNGQPAPDDMAIVQDPQTGGAYYMREEIDLLAEKVIFEHVHRKDFNHACANNWERVMWVSFDTYLDRDEVEARYGKKVAVELNYEHKAGDEDPTEAESKLVGDDGDYEKLALILEVWCKKTKKVYYVSEGYSDHLQVIDDPYNLKGFFPCPKPYYVNLQSKKLMTRPDYAYYRHKVKTYELLLQRERELVGALMVRGLAEEAFFPQLQKIQKVGNVEFVPVNMTQIVERGGVKALVDVFVVPEIGPMLQQIESEKQQIKQEIFEISGLADIIRGVSDPNETATAQQIKGQFATMRLGDKQKNFQNFARDILALAGEFVAENFDDQTLWQLSAMDFEDEEDKALFPQAVELVRNDPQRRIAIDIETDSTIAITEDLQKQAWAEYIGTVAGAVPNFIQMIQAMPSFAGYWAKIIEAGSRLHKFGRAVEQELDSGIEGLMQQMQQPPQPPQPTIDQQIDMKKIEVDQEKAAMDFQARMAQLQADQEQFRQELEHKYSTLMTNVQSLAAKISADFDMQNRKRADSSLEATRSDLAGG